MVIPAKAGIQSVGGAFPVACGVASRFCGNECTSERPCLANDASTQARGKEQVAQRGGAATKPVGASGAGPGLNAVRPYEVREDCCKKKTRICGIATQSCFSNSAALFRLPNTQAAVAEMSPVFVGRLHKTQCTHHPRNQLEPQRGDLSQPRAAPWELRNRHSLKP